MAISMKELLALGKPPRTSSLRTFLRRNHPGLLSMREAARLHGLRDEPPKTIETAGIVFVKKDATTLAPNAFFTIVFRPSNGPVLFNGRGHPAPPDAVAGGAVPLIRPNANDFITSGLFGEPLAAPERRRIPRVSVPLDARLTLEDSVFADPLAPISDEGIPPLPPQATALVRLEVFRESKPGPVLTHDFLNSQTARISISDAPKNIVDFAPEEWRAVFRNISDGPIQCFGRVLFRERRRLQITRLPLALLRRLLDQAVAGLGLELRLREDTLTVDFSLRAKELFDLKPITKNFGFKVFGDIRLKATRIELGDAAVPGEPGRFPRIRITVEFEEEGPELSLDVGADDIDIELSGLHFTLDLVMRTRIFPFAGNGRLRGDFPWVPFIASDISIDTDARFSSRVLGALREPTNVLLDILDLVVAINTIGKVRIKDRIPTLKEALISAGEEIARDMSFAISNYLQTAIQVIVDRDLAFHGIRVADGEWEVLGGPIPPPAPGGEGGVVVIPPAPPLADRTPIDGPQPDSDLENLQRINHVVVLMLENRSYDHVLGYLSHPGHGSRAEFDGLTGHESNAIEGLPLAVPTPMTSTKFFPSPPHEFEPVLAQVADGEMTGFGEAFKAAIERANHIADPRSIMNFHVDGQLRTYDRLVREFAVAKRWFASLPGPTFPNRLCTISGSTAFLNNRDIPTEDRGYLAGRTIFDLLDEAHVDWRYYEHDIAFLRMLKRRRLETSRIRGFERFATDARVGLPPVTFIDPNFVDIPSAGVANDDHPGGSDMANGQRLVAEIINAVKASPGWNDTLLIISYDEHGGFYDHVPPPGTPPSRLTGMFRVHPDAPQMLGVRVPAFFVSPRVRPGDIIPRVFDHTSILKSIIVRFLPGAEHRLGRRVERAAHLGQVVPLAEPRTGIGDFEVGPILRLTQKEVVEQGSFHDMIRTIGNPLNQSDQRIRTMMPVF